jgi:BirA family biotin operon repressor/biotin-[acetyl-CoA-carboxylase] ligase
MLNITELNKKLNSIYFNNTSLKMLFKNHVSSTNDYLNYKYARDLFPLLIISNNQRAARGRNKKKWISLNQKSISFSLCFKINANHFDLRHLVYMSCISLLDVLVKNTSKSIKIKWPNDLFLDNRKVSGILIESLSVNKEIFVSIGIGINLNIPSNYSIGKPYSNLDRHVDESVLISSFCELFFDYINKMNIEKAIKIFNENLIWHQERVRITDDKNTYEGILLGINEQGELTLQINDNIKCINNIDSTMRRV